jgi:hypothetical protein
MLAADRRNEASQCPAQRSQPNDRRNEVSPTSRTRAPRIAHPASRV